MTTPEPTQIHATCVDLFSVGILLRGPSGAGKSDFALRLIDLGAILVADDRTDLRVEQGALIAEPPELIAGKLEIRGVGILNFPYQPRSRVGLVVDLVPSDQVERMPGRGAAEYLGVRVNLVALNPFEASATAKLRLLARRAQPGGLRVAS